MPKINKTKSGLLLHEDFKQNPLMWIPSPSNYNNISFNEDGLRIKHSDKYTTITLQQPEGNFSFMCKLNHKPIDADDIGGVIIMNNDTFYAECQSYISDKPSYITNSNPIAEQIRNYIDEILNQYVEFSIDDEETDDNNPNENNPDVPSNFSDVLYPYIKFNKMNNKYTFLASHDGVTWIEIGNTDMPDSNRLGFFLYSYDKDITDSHFYVEYATLYDSNYVIIENIRENQEIELRDENGNILCDSKSTIAFRKDNSIYIDTTLLSMPYDNLTLSILQNNIVICDYSITQFVGGDIYSYWHNLKVCIDNIELNQNDVFDLGTFYNNSQTIRIDIYNQEEYDITDLKVSITAYSPYYDGNETMSISLYDENEENYDFSDKVTIPLIKPSEGKSILLKLTNRIIQDFYKKAGKYRFKINIE